MLALLLGALAALCGCDATRSPSLAVADARIVERRSEATLVHLTLELTNPNIEPLPLVEFQYRADLDGMTDLMAFLIEDCCDGRAELCAPLHQIVQSAACCEGAQKKSRRRV